MRSDSTATRQQVGVKQLRSDFHAFANRKCRRVQSHSRRWKRTPVRCTNRLVATFESRGPRIKSPRKSLRGARDPLERRARESPGALFPTTATARNYVRKANPAKTCDLRIGGGRLWLFGVIWHWFQRTFSTRRCREPDALGRTWSCSQLGVPWGVSDAETESPVHPAAIAAPTLAVFLTKARRLMARCIARFSTANVSDKGCSTATITT